MDKLLDVAALAGMSRPIVRSDYRWEVDYPGRTFTLPLLFATLKKRDGHHDVLNLEYAGRSLKGVNRVKQGDPVRFRFQTPYGMKTWYGYVHNVTTTSQTQGAVTRVRCVGASWVLKNTTQKVYKNKTADRVAKLILYSHGLIADLQRHPKVLKTVSNTGQTEWQLLRRLASQTGFALVPDNFLVKFKPRLSIFEESKAKKLTFMYHDESVPAASTFTQVFNFQAHIVDDSPELNGAVDQVVSGVHEQTDQIMVTKHKTRKKRKSARFTKHRVTDVARSYSDSVSLTADAEAAAYKYRAKATLLGNTDVEVFNAILLTNIAGDMSGYWQVLSVDHIFGGAVPYLLEVELGSNGLDTEDSAPISPNTEVDAEAKGDTYDEDSAVLQYVDTYDDDYYDDEPKNSGTILLPVYEDLGDLTDDIPDFSLIGSDQEWVVDPQGLGEISAVEYGSQGYEDTSASSGEVLEAGTETLLDTSGDASTGLVDLGDLSTKEYVYVSGWIRVAEAEPDILISFGRSLTPTFLIKAKDVWAFFYQKIDPFYWPQIDGAYCVVFDAVDAASGAFLLRDFKVTSTPINEDSPMLPGGGDQLVPGSVVSTDDDPYLVYVGEATPMYAKEGDLWVDSNGVIP